MSYIHTCTKCNSDVEYTKRAYYRVDTALVLCTSCGGKHRGKATVSPTDYYRNCPKCSVTIYYTSKSNLSRAVKSNSICSKCSTKCKVAQNLSQKVSKSLSGKKYPNRASNERKTKQLRYFRNCPACGSNMGYVNDWTRDRADKQGSVCNSCSARIFKKSWSYVIQDKHIKKMAATKAGFSTYEEYLANLDARKKYYREVRRITRKQPIHLLEHFDKVVGRCGAPGAYQLDHKISIRRGFEQNIPAEVIGHIDNLQFIPWQENLKKSYY